MIHFLLVFLILVSLLLILVACVALGQWFGRRQLLMHPKQKLEVVKVAEASVFALLGLLIAFTFSGAYQRFENRKIHILEEANAYDAALYYTDVAGVQFQEHLRQNIYQYINLQLAAYHHFPYVHLVKHDLDQALMIEQRIWKITVAACLANPNQGMAQLLMQSISDMFETAHMGMNLCKVHPPAIIFLLMIFLAGLGAFLIGYDSTENKQKRPIHTICYIALTAVTIYIIMNLEFPRTGFIQYEYFDKIITDVRDHSNTFFSNLFPF